MALIGLVGSCGNSRRGQAATNPTTPVTDMAQLVNAFNSWEMLPTTCLAELISGSVRVATVPNTGASWAIANFRPPSDCVKTMRSRTPGATVTVPLAQIGPWGRVPQPPVGVFERMRGGAWVMNDEGGRPFPCPAPGGSAPGPGNGALPASVLATWHLKYASGCAEVVYPLEPR